MIGDQLLGVVTRASPALRETLRRYGDRPVRELLATIRAGRSPGLQSLDGFAAAVGAEAAAGFGRSVGAAVAEQVVADPIIATSNHFGIETVAESAQATVLFSLRPAAGGPPRYVVVLGFGSISMNNWSYPMGLQLYDSSRGRLPQRLPVFPDRVKQQAVCTVGPYDGQMLQRARTRLARMRAGGAVSSFGAHAAGAVIDEVLGSPGTLALPSYRAQSPVVNLALWRRMLRVPGLGELVQLQAERVCARLLRHDLTDPASLAHRLLLAEEVRERLVAALDGTTGCWHRAELARRLAASAPGEVRTGGTVFFWGVTDGGRRVPLTLRRERRRWQLVGVDDHGGHWRTELSPDGIRAGLDAGRLLPSMFTCFAVVAFARGVSCVGGYFQADYLPVMRAGILHALAGLPAHRDAARAVARVSTGLCLAGLQGLVRELDDGSVIPAGLVELAALGADSPALEAFLAMPVRDAHLVALTELADVLAAAADLPPDWRGRLARENARRRRIPPSTPRRTSPPGASRDRYQVAPPPTSHQVTELRRHHAHRAG